MSLSKVWTAGDVEDAVRVNVSEVLPDFIQPYTFYKYINLAISEIAIGINDQMLPDYGATYNPIVAGMSASVSTLSISSIIKVTDPNRGQIAAKTITEMNNLANINSFRRSALYSYFGENLYFFTGSMIAETLSPTLYYYRLPVPVTASADFIDIRDKYVPQVIGKVKEYVLAQSGIQAQKPEAKS